jgi:hypothetical protein
VEDDSTFGKPSAPREMWESSARLFRDTFLEEVSVSNAAEIRVARAALLLAAEDDAVNTRSAVPLPVESYLGRVEGLADDFVAFGLGDAADAPSQAAALDVFLYTTCRFRLPTVFVELYSPYRMYLHNVLAQRVGVSHALATVHLAVLRLLQTRGVLPDVLEAAQKGSAGLPFTRVRGAGAQGKALCAAELVRTTLDGLTRAYWPWEWHPEEASGFVAAAAAASGESGRVGRVFMNTVMQPTGRPYGDLERARLALERTCALASETSIAHRDLAVLLAHVGRTTEALGMLKQYRDSSAGRAAAARAMPVPDGVAGSLLGAGAVDAASRARAAQECAALDQLIVALERASLELAIML